jgi:hypothetical protein
VLEYGYFIECGATQQAMEENLNCKLEFWKKLGWRFHKVYEEFKEVDLKVRGGQPEKIRFVTVELKRHSEI